MQEPERFSSPAYLAVLDSEPATGGATVADDLPRRLHALAEAGYPHEICGLLLGRIQGDDWQITDIRQVTNLNTERAADRFQLDPAGYQQVDRELRGTGIEIIGVFHSHPDAPAKPSPTDLGSAWEGFLYPIVSIDNGEWCETRCWTLNPSGDRFREVIWTESPNP